MGRSKDRARMLMLCEMKCLRVCIEEYLDWSKRTTIESKKEITSMLEKLQEAAGDYGRHRPTQPVHRRHSTQPNSREAEYKYGAGRGLAGHKPK